MRLIPHADVVVATNSAYVSLMVGDTQITVTQEDARSIADALMKAAREAERLQGLMAGGRS